MTRRIGRDGYGSAACAGRFTARAVAATTKQAQVRIPMDRSSLGFYMFEIAAARRPMTPAPDRSCFNPVSAGGLAAYLFACCSVALRQSLGGRDCQQSEEFQERCCKATIALSHSGQMAWMRLHPKYRTELTTFRFCCRQRSRIT